MSEMLPCPFCGRTDLLGMEPRPESGFLGVRCRACGAIGPTGRPIDGEPGARDEAVAHWNRRARVAEQKPEPVDRCSMCGTVVTPGQLIGNTLANGAMPAMVKQSAAAMRLHTEETDQLRKRVAELEAGLAVVLDEWSRDSGDNYESLALLLAGNSAGNSDGNSSADPYEGRTPWPHPSEESEDTSDG